MAGITLNTNVAALGARRRLAEGTAGLSATFQRLSSGLRINRANDDAAGLAIADALHLDSRIYNQAIRNLNDGISCLNIAADAAGELASIVERLQELAEEAANGTLGDAQRGALDLEAQALAEEYNRIVRTTELNGIKMLDGSNSSIILQAGISAERTLGVPLAGIVTQLLPDGTFRPANALPGGVTGANRTRVGDVDGDGIPDIVSADRNAGSVLLWLGNGDGTFGSRVTIFLGGNPGDVAIVDLDNDGKNDIFVDDTDSGQTKVLLGNGDGTFASPQNGPTLYFRSGALGTADLNGDGNQDVVVLSSWQVPGPNVALLGNGDGTFQTPGSAVGAQANADAQNGSFIGDFNGDGKPDLLIVDITSTYALLGNGAGSFTATGQTFGSPGNTRGFTLGDFNGDGKLDFARNVDHSQGNTVEVFLGNGDGTFQSTQSNHFESTWGFTSGSLVSGDFTGDGIVDLIAARTGANKLLVGNGDGTFSAPVALDIPGFPGQFVASDLNGDGAIDLVSTDGQVSLANTQASYILAAPNLATADAARDALQRMRDLHARIEATRGALGASLSRIQVALSVNGTAASELDSAESRIRDADVAEDSASLIRGELLQRAGTAVLAQANRAPALALKLLEDVR
jgi:flagellin-like hook-associated protein FlgL